MVPAPLVPVVLAQVLVLAQLLQPQLPVLALLVVEPVVAVQLLSRQSFSAAMAGSTPKPRATYEPVPRSR